MPFFLLPPALSLVVATMSLRRSPRYSELDHFEWIAIFSAINLTLSVIVLYKFHFPLAEVIQHLGDKFKVILDGFLPGPQHPSIRATPI